MSHSARWEESRSRQNQAAVVGLLTTSESIMVDKPDVGCVNGVSGMPGGMGCMRQRRYGDVKTQTLQAKNG